MSGNVYCNINMTVFDIIGLGCGQQGSGPSYTTMHICSQHYLSKNFCQYIKSKCCCMRHIVQICHHLIFFLFPQLKWSLIGHCYADNSGHSDGCDKTAPQHIIKCLPELLKDLQKCWKWCTDARRSCFRGDP